MNAKDARRLYIEDYVEFEHLLKDLCKKFNITLKEEENLFTLIYKIKKSKKHPYVKINFKELNKQRKTRNIIMHTRWYIKIKKSRQFYLKEIYSLNNQIKT